ncbi:expressed unknown protein [Seminavis robusta]|uniref:Uncharacterized protein n=1 Tax=Seminavis robusta TaxID=568900 RepID=A0A9N8ECW7_9STRA|nr:expressed unknown protein [Seminavis robusta]|eukprot:Sro991_g228660.1 n/a (183) ;mRNA; r:5216-5764
MKSSILLATAAVCLALSFCAEQISAFAPSSTGSYRQSTSLSVFGKKSGGVGGGIKPTFDAASGKWQKGPDDDGVYAYDAVGALLRYGPGPFIKRTFDADGYEQEILNFMAASGCDRSEATGNMDFKFDNAADWMYRKVEEKRTGKKIDLNYLDKKKAALTIIWALGITPMAFYVVSETVRQF